MKTENEKEVLIDESLPEIKVELDKGFIPTETKEIKKSNNSELVWAVILIVLIIGVWIGINYFNKKNNENG